MGEGVRRGDAPIPEDAIYQTNPPFDHWVEQPRWAMRGCTGHASSVGSLKRERFLVVPVRHRDSLGMTGVLGEKWEGNRRTDLTLRHITRPARRDSSSFR